MRRLSIIIALGFSTGAAIAAVAELQVRQSDKQFSPGRLTVAKGSTVQFVNDEALVHHAFVDTPGFVADTGDISPGESKAIMFSKAGSFTVRCAIHPQMRMSVQVSEE